MTKISDLSDIILKAQVAYYNGSSIIDDDEYDASALIQEVIAAEQAHKEAVAEYTATMEMIKNRRVAHIKELVAQNVPVADIAKVYPRKLVLEVTAPVVTQPAAAEVAQSA